MKDWFDELNDHPARVKCAEFGTRRFICQLESGDGELLTFTGSVDYRVDEFGLTVERYDYSPKNELMRESVEDFIESLF